MVQTMSKDIYLDRTLTVPAFLQFLLVKWQTNLLQTMTLFDGPNEQPIYSRCLCSVPPLLCYSSTFSLWKSFYQLGGQFYRGKLMGNRHVAIVWEGFKINDCKSQHNFAIKRSTNGGGTIWSNYWSIYHFYAEGGRITFYITHTFKGVNLACLVDSK